MAVAFRVKLFPDRIMKVCRDCSRRWLSKLVSDLGEEKKFQAGGRCMSFEMACVVRGGLCR